MTPTDTIPADLTMGLFDGTGLGNMTPGATLVDGHDFYDDRDDADSSLAEPSDPISVAIGTPGFMGNHIVGECVQRLGDAQTEPEEFDRFYFAPQDPTYSGPAPLLMDLIQGVTPDEQRIEEEDKHIAFKREWCRSHGVTYVILRDIEDIAMSPDQLRARIEAEINPPPPVVKVEQPTAEKPKPGRRRAGVQRVGAGGD